MSTDRCQIMSYSIMAARDKHSRHYKLGAFKIPHFKLCNYVWVHYNSVEDCYVVCEQMNASQDRQKYRLEARVKVHKDRVVILPQERLSACFRTAVAQVVTVGRLQIVKGERKGIELCVPHYSHREISQPMRSMISGNGGFTLTYEEFVYTNIHPFLGLTEMTANYVTSIVPDAPPLVRVVDDSARKAMNAKIAEIRKKILPRVKLGCIPTLSVNDFNEQRRRENKPPILMSNQMKYFEALDFDNIDTVVDFFYGALYGSVDWYKYGRTSSVDDAIRYFKLGLNRIREELKYRDGVVRYEEAA